ncbi:metallo-beta-lactamase superfamily domain-containing protein [Pochonia chlamydosporia 170]|uniref:Metallo-beta-lactamase superfamily domain-containing protein n=1 Tax=Pochonia chlamydosporia 170 TaxID=1380566 RepID=A0A179FYU7_METCM|nr:metallo-beta-lactamase superfamily domain-containing protein [Pochonia chlamydosporia 170]OAQ70557.1 metallo-beta-lactamase superfamily domain-containing protein [Pochonia chlamydosporia 170]
MCGNSNTIRPNAAYFNCTQLNKSTFMVTENDRYGEVPQIFIKVYPSTIVVIDTGCGGDVNDTRATLATFLETEPVVHNGNAPINQQRKPYTVIRGMTDFAKRPNSTIWASSHNKAFLSPDALPRNSLCDNVGMETPKYTITNWISDGQTITDQSGQDLNLTVYHTPGHTPDHVAIWDPEERHLYVGDTLYRHAPVFFMFGGSVIDYSKTIDKLNKLVGKWNRESGVYIGSDKIKKVSSTDLANPVKDIAQEHLSRVKLSCGHITNNVDAGEILDDVSTFLRRVVIGEAQPVHGGENYGIKSVTYTSKDGSLGFSGFEAAFEEFLGNDGATEAVRQRIHVGERLVAAIICVKRVYTRPKVCQDIGFVLALDVYPAMYHPELVTREETTSVQGHYSFQNSNILRLNDTLISWEN